MDPGVEGSNPFTHPINNKEWDSKGMDKEQLIEKIKAESKNGKIACRQALKLASEADVSPKVLGDMLNELKIKIMGCQLGCFP